MQRKKVRGEVTWSGGRKSKPGRGEGRAARPDEPAPPLPPAPRRRRVSPAAIIIALLALATAAVIAYSWQQAQAGAAAGSPRPLAVATPLGGVPPVANASLQQPDGREHRWLGRPLARTALRDFADRTYLFGASHDNAYRVHHGMDFWNPSGTLVQAPGDGTVVFAGKDPGTRFGPQTIPNFYGNMLLVKLGRTFHDKDVYYVLGHFDSLLVKEGQPVKAGDNVGRIGMTGTADGPHLHMEVRVGGTTYADSYNPALWLQPLPGAGSLAGVIKDRAGAPIPGTTVTLIKDISASDIQKYWGESPTYPADKLGKLNPDPDWRENIAFVDLPLGSYEARVTLGGQTYTRQLVIRDGRTTWLEIQEDGPTE